MSETTPSIDTKSLTEKRMRRRELITKGAIGAAILAAAYVAPQITTVRARANGQLTPPPSNGCHDCSLGYWKQEQHFDSWPAGYAPGDLYSAHFVCGTDATPHDAKTLLEVLGLGGGGDNALGRQSVAALLDAARAEDNQDCVFGFSVQEVKDMVCAAFNGGDVGGTKDDLEAAIDECEGEGSDD